MEVARKRIMTWKPGKNIQEIDFASMRRRCGLARCKFLIIPGWWEVDEVIIKNIHAKHGRSMALNDLSAWKLLLLWHREGDRLEGNTFSLFSHSCMGLAIKTVFRQVSVNHSGLCSSSWGEFHWWTWRQEPWGL